MRYDNESIYQTYVVPILRTHVPKGWTYRFSYDTITLYDAAFYSYFIKLSELDLTTEENTIANISNIVSLVTAKAKEKYYQ